MKSQKVPAICFALTIACFYLLPLFIKDTGSAMIILLIVQPACCLIVSVFYGTANKRFFIYPLFVMAAFSPCIFIYFNTSAWIYIPVYGGISLTGALIGCLIKKNSL